MRKREKKLVFSDAAVGGNHIGLDWPSITYMLAS